MESIIIITFIIVVIIIIVYFYEEKRNTVLSGFNIRALIITFVAWMLVKLEIWLNVSRGIQQDML